MSLTNCTTPAFYFDTHNARHCADLACEHAYYASLLNKVRNMNYFWSDLKIQTLFNCLNILTYPITLTREADNLTKGFHALPQPLQANFRLLPRDKPRFLHFTLFPSYHSQIVISDRIIVLSFDAM